MTAPASGDKAAKTRGELLTGPVFPMVVKFGVPTMVSMLTPAIYNLTGAYFVSTLGTTAVAALGIVFSLHMILAAVGIMTGQGCASQTSRLLGAGEYEAAGFIAGTGILLSVLGGVAIGVLGLLFDEPLLRVLGATPTIMPDAVRYAEVLLIGSPVVCASFTFNNLLRSEGLAVVGMRALLAGGILNLALTPAFILGLGFGIEGAAWAAVLSQAAGLLILVNHYRRKAGLLRIIPPTLERLRRLSPTILRNGMPSLLRNALAAVAASILNLTAGGFGDAAVAAMSIVSRVLMTVNAVMVGLGPGLPARGGLQLGRGQLRARQEGARLDHRRGHRLHDGGCDSGLHLFGEHRLGVRGRRPRGDGDGHDGHALGVRGLPLHRRLDDRQHDLSGPRPPQGRVLPLEPQAGLVLPAAHPHAPGMVRPHGPVRLPASC